MDKKYRMVVTTVSGKRYLSVKNFSEASVVGVTEMLVWNRVERDGFLEVDTAEGFLYVNYQNIETISFIDY